MIQALALVVGLLGPAADTAACPSPQDSAVWASSFAPYLRQPLWAPSRAYDAGFELMVPVHAAFALDLKGWQAALGAQFADFAQHGVSAHTKADDRLAESQYLFLAAEFLAEAAAHQRLDVVPPGLAAAVHTVLQRQWSGDTTYISGRAISGGLAARAEWRLSHPKTSPNYLAAYDDRDRHAFATAADLLYYDRIADPATPPPAWLNGVLDVAWKVFHQRVVWQPDGGWLFQPGVRWDHSDFQFAGWTTTAEATIPKRHPGLAEDVPHSFRWPAWLHALKRAEAPDPERAAYYESLLHGLEIQFFHHVLVQPDTSFPALRTVNYMDGWNGLYRWERKGLGYGPYETSGNLTMGMWGLFQVPESRALYEQLYREWPLAPKVEQLYEARGQSGHDLGGNSYQDGVRQMLVHLAACLPDR